MRARTLGVLNIVQSGTTAPRRPLLRRAAAAITDRRLIVKVREPAVSMRTTRPPAPRARLASYARMYRLPEKAGCTPVIATRTDAPTYPAAPRGARVARSMALYTQTAKNRTATTDMLRVPCAAAQGSSAIWEFPAGADCGKYPRMLARGNPGGRANLTYAYIDRYAARGAHRSAATCIPRWSAVRRRVGGSARPPRSAPWST